MLKILVTAALAAISLTACSDAREIRIGDASGIDPAILQEIDVSDRQSILFGHYEHLITVHGQKFEGCCVFDANRIELANHVVSLFESSTGKSFNDREMLIGSMDDKVFVYIVPKSLSATPLQPTYVVELDRKTARLNSFKSTTN